MLSFSYGEDSDEYEIVKDVFFDNEQDIDIDPDYPEENYHLDFTTYTNDSVMEFTYTYSNVKISEIQRFTKYLFDYLNNSFDILYEQFDEEFCLSAEEDEEDEE